MAKDFGISNWRGKQVFTLATEANVVAMTKAAILLEKDVKENFTLQGTGRASRRTKSGKVHRASTPGQSPAIDLGNLRASIMHSVEKKSLGIEGKVGPDIEHLAAKTAAGTDVNYGYYLEVGTRNIEPRPYLVPALRRTGPKVEKIFKDANK